MGYALNNQPAPLYDALHALLKPQSATKAATSDVRFELTAIKASEEDEGVIIGKLSVAGNFDREKERVTLPALKAATFNLVKKIGTDAVAVDINHEDEAIKCDILQAWIGEPMPDPTATYVALRPHDPDVYECAKKGGIVGMSWSGPYKLVDAAV